MSKNAKQLVVVKNISSTHVLVAVQNKSCQQCVKSNCCRRNIKQISLAKKLLPDDIKVGQHLVLQIPNKVIRNAALILYGLPFMCILILTVLSNIYDFTTQSLLCLIISSIVTTIFGAKILSEKIIKQETGLTALSNQQETLR